MPHATIIAALASDTINPSQAQHRLHLARHTDGVTGANVASICGSTGTAFFGVSGPSPDRALRLPLFCRRSWDEANELLQRHPLPRAHVCSINRARRKIGMVRSETISLAHKGASVENRAEATRPLSAAHRILAHPTHLPLYRLPKRRFYYALEDAHVA